MLRITRVVAGVAWAMVVGGCATAEYRGASPSVRSFQDVPREAKDVYVGMNWNFSLDRQTAYHAEPYAGGAAVAQPAVAGAE